MTQDYKHPIAPPEELVEQWLDQSKHVTGRNGGCKLISVTNHRLISICAKAAQWGADQELEACCEWVRSNGHHGSLPDKLRSIRRPKPPVSKEEALAALDLLCEGPDPTTFVKCRTAIRRALESIPDPS